MVSRPRTSRGSLCGTPEDSVDDRAVWKGGDKWMLGFLAKSSGRTWQV
jgi:hypothetical protein